MARTKQMDEDRKKRATDRQKELDAKAADRKKNRDARQSETAAEQRDRAKAEREEREKTRVERANRAKSERQRMTDERNNRRGTATAAAAAEREKARLARQREADKRRTQAETDRRRDRLNRAGWSPTLITAVEGPGDYRAMLRGAPEAVEFSEAKETRSLQWVEIIDSSGEITEIKLDEIVAVSGVADAVDETEAEAEPPLGENVAEGAAAAAVEQRIAETDLDKAVVPPPAPDAGWTGTGAQREG